MEDQRTGSGDLSDAAEGSPVEESEATQRRPRVPQGKRRRAAATAPPGEDAPGPGPPPTPTPNPTNRRHRRLPSSPRPRRSCSSSAPRRAGVPHRDRDRGRAVHRGRRLRRGHGAALHRRACRSADQGRDCPHRSRCDHHAVDLHPGEHGSAGQPVGALPGRRLSGRVPQVHRRDRADQPAGAGQQLHRGRRRRGGEPRRSGRHRDRLHQLHLDEPVDQGHPVAEVHLLPADAAPGLGRLAGDRDERDHQPDLTPQI